MSRYSITIKNNGTFKGNMSLFQKQPDLEEISAMSLAWLSKGSNPGTMLKFSWSDDYNFVWSECGQLKPGIIFNASQTIPTDLKTNNKVTFTKNEFGYLFTDQITESISAGKLVIEESGLILGGGASVGIGMSGSPIFVWESEPNSKLVIEPKVEYWLTYGSYQQGEVLNVQQLVDKSTKIDFPINTYNAEVTLNSNNTWGEIIYK